MRLFLLILYIVLLPIIKLSAQTSNITIDNNSSIMLIENNKICSDEITVQNGSSFNAEYFGDVLDGNCTNVLTPGGGGNITLPIEVFEIVNLPTQFTVETAYPNPFNPSTTIRYGLPNLMDVTISIYDISGRLIGILFQAKQPEGWYEITWNGQINDGSIAPAGIYIYQIMAGDEIKTNKISLVK